MTDNHEGPSKLGELLAEQRLRRGKSLRQVGGSILGSGYLAQLETGGIQDVMVTRLREICTAYDLPLLQVLHEAYGVELPDENADPRATALGQDVLGLPEREREMMIDYIAFQKARATPDSSTS